MRWTGVIVGLFHKAEHSHKFLPYDDVAGKGRDPGYMGSLVATRDYAAVTAALLVSCGGRRPAGAY